MRDGWFSQIIKAVLGKKQTNFTEDSRGTSEALRTFSAAELATPEALW